MRFAPVLPRLFGSAGLLLALALVARGDEVRLVGGGVLRGEVVSQTGEGLTIRTRGGTATVPLSRVLEVERGPSLEQAYRDRAARIDPDDAEAHFALGLWLKSVRCLELARLEFARALQLDPGHRFAAAELSGLPRDGEGALLPGGAGWQVSAPLPAAASRESTPGEEAVRDALRATAQAALLTGRRDEPGRSARLAGTLEALRAAAQACGEEAAPAPQAANSPREAGERALLERLQELRRLFGLPPLRPDPALAAQARGGRAAAAGVVRFEARASGPGAAFQAWVCDPLVCAALLDPACATLGLARVGERWVLALGR